MIGQPRPANREPEAGVGATLAQGRHAGGPPGASGTLPPGPGGVDTAGAQAAHAAGAHILKDPHDVFWGGYIAYFSDPDGHVWEIAHNPFSPLRDDGAFRWLGYGGK